MMKILSRVFPILTWLPSYQRTYLRGDLFAGLTVGVMLIPQGMAYALIAGLPPVYGLYASIMPQLVYAILGTSRQLSVGPVAMDSLLVAAGVSVLATEGTDTYIRFTLLLAFLMGSVQLVFGLLKMGFITNLLSKPVISGFTSAAAMIIAMNQFEHLLGVEIEKRINVIEMFLESLQQLNHIHAITLSLGLAGVGLIWSARKVHEAIPGALVAVVLGILAADFFGLEDSGVAIVGDIPKGLPAFQLPFFSLEEFGELVPLALTISIVAFMESYSVAKSIEAKRGDHKVDPNQELIGLGSANLVGALFQSYPVTGGFSRSAVNDQAGARTPLSSLFSAILIGLTLLFLTPLFYHLPKAILAAIIMVAVYGLIDLSYMKKLWKESKPEFLLLLFTFTITLHLGMVPGILSGVVLSVLFLLHRAAYPHIAILGRLEGRSEFRNVKRFSSLEQWDDKLILRIDAALTFINIQFLKDFLEDELGRNHTLKNVIIDAAAVSHIDATATIGLSEIITTLRERQIDLLVTDLIGPVRDVLFKTGLLEEIGIKNVYLSLNDAVEQSTDLTYRSREEAIQHGIIGES